MISVVFVAGGWAIDATIIDNNWNATWNVFSFQQINKMNERMESEWTKMLAQTTINEWVNGVKFLVQVCWEILVHSPYLS